MPTNPSHDKLLYEWGEERDYLLMRAHQADDEGNHTLASCLYDEAIEIGLKIQYYVKGYSYE